MWPNVIFFMQNKIFFNEALINKPHQQVQQIQEESAKLQASYAGDKAKEITNREAEVLAAWAALQGECDARKRKLADAGDLYRFLGLVRTLMLWMDDCVRQMNTGEKPR